MAKVVTEATLEGDLVVSADLAKIPAFATAGPLNDMYPGAMVYRRFRAGEVICSEGEGGSTAFYIVEGTVNVAIQAAASKAGAKKRGLLAVLGGLFGQKPTSATPSHAPDTLVPIDATVDLKYGKKIAEMGPGDLFGEMSCLTNAPRSATVTAKTDCVLLEILRNIYEKLLKDKTFKEKMDDDYREKALNNHLRSVPVFASLSEPAIDRLKKTAELVSVNPGAVIIKEGDAADGMYIIRLGQVKVTKKFPGGDVTLAYLGKSDCFGEVGLLRNTKRTATCIAYAHPGKDNADRVRYYPKEKSQLTRAKDTPVELVKIKSEDVQWLMSEFPDVKRELEALARRADANDNQGDEEVPVVPRIVEDLGLLQGKGLLLIDLEKCTRCDQCVTACVESHDDGVQRLIREGPRFENYLVPSRCRICVDPLCMIGCPVGSIRRTKDLNILIEDWCIGCGLCAANCPYNSIQMRDVGDLREKESAGAAAPDRKERAVVCDQCSSLPQGPACVYACPHDAAARVNARDFLHIGITVSARAAAPAVGAGV